MLRTCSKITPRSSRTIIKYIRSTESRRSSPMIASITHLPPLSLKRQPLTNTGRGLINLCSTWKTWRRRVSTLRAFLHFPITSKLWRRRLRTARSLSTGRGLEHLRGIISWSLSFLPRGKNQSSLTSKPVSTPTLISWRIKVFRIASIKRSLAQNLVWRFSTTLYFKRTHLATSSRHHKLKNRWYPWKMTKSSRTTTAPGISLWSPFLFRGFMTHPLIFWSSRLAFFCTSQPTSSSFRSSRGFNSTLRRMRPSLTCLTTSTQKARTNVFGC